jgi:hypothetical protein
MGCWESQAHKASNAAIKMYTGNFMPDRRMDGVFAPQDIGISNLGIENLFGMVYFFFNPKFLNLFSEF